MNRVIEALAQAPDIPLVALVLGAAVGFTGKVLYDRISGGGQRRYVALREAMDSLIALRASLVRAAIKPAAESRPPNACIAEFLARLDQVASAYPHKQRVGIALSRATLADQLTKDPSDLRLESELDNVWLALLALQRRDLEGVRFYRPTDEDLDTATFRTAPR